MRLLLVLCAGLAAVAAGPTSQQRIIGGSAVDISDYPQVVALLRSTDLSTYRQACAGAILNTRNILTSANCLDGDTTPQWRARVGSTTANSGGSVHATLNWLLHPDFNSRTMDCDFAMLRTASTIVYVNNLVQAGAIAGNNYFIGNNDVFWTSGWGATAWLGEPSENLQHVELQAINQATCVERYGSIGYAITENMLCAGWLDGGRDACDNDAGGPVFHNGVIVGINSWGFQCGLARFPGVKSRVSSASLWIQANA